VKLRILHKGLILLLFPLVLQGFVLVQLYDSFQESEHLSKAEERVSSLIDYCDEIIADIIRVFQQILEAMEGNATEWPDPDAVYLKASATINKAEALTNHDPGMDALLMQLHSLWDDLLPFLKQLNNSRSETNTTLSHFTQILMLKPKALALGRKVLLVENFKHIQVDALRQKREQIHSHRESIASLIVLSALGEIALTFALLSFFLMDVTKRMSMLVDNASLIPKGKTLINRVSGGDELAYLDKVLHAASESLRESAEHRKAISEMLSHDLRAPLLSANLSLDLLLSPKAMDSIEQHDNRVSAIKKNLTRLVGFVEDLLTIDKLESGKLQLSLAAVELRSLVEDVFDSLVPQSQAKEVTLKNGVQEIEVVADRNRLHQVFMNLLSNAIKFSPVGSEIIVSSESTSKEVIVSVKDQGPGISKENQDSLFQKFHQIDGAEAKSGFGLGLSISKLIISKHEGRMGVTSEEGKGSTFWFSLPFEPEDDI